MKPVLFIIPFLITLLSSFCAEAQNNSNPILTPVPFLTISPDARSGGMGDGGVAFSDDANTTFWNPARMSFLSQPSNASISYSPWLRKIIPGSYFGYASFVQKIDDRNAIGFSIRQLKLGKIDLYDNNAQPLGSYEPNEYSIDASYARTFGQNFSLALSLRYIHSDISNSTAVQEVETKPINTISTDVSVAYNYPFKDGVYSFGLDISNIGPKVSYTTGGQKYFLPINLRLGPSWTFFSEQFQTTIAFDINKLLVPTPPLRDSNGDIIKGRDDNRSVVSGIFGSFSDAPGGFDEELKEVYGSASLELVYVKRFAMRLGYFYDNKDKGNRQYATTGIGILLDPININLAYVIAQQMDSPFANALRFSLILHLNENKK
ncbi:type IX secretion system outer membrane channel protein PorV [Mucilaginibacter sp.]|uniref:type IX secretion system outer membrane channel protein PorV n=1 Tax=Mucilaginibacter sp. TaxID=1882438 RepID=UPI0025EE41E3|nr:type IX secretion system outer membrane channel protein PorV [Mucilaginibacter sp.]